jgi:hypothetical protein
MEIYRTFESFIKKVNEDALKAGEESDVYIDDYTLDSGETIKSAEILGAIQAYQTEKEFQQYFFDEYGEGSFASGELDKLTKFFNEVKAEEKEEDADSEKEEKKGDEGGDEGGDDLDIDI